MKNLAFGVAIIIMAFGIIGFFVPTCLIWVAQHAANSGAFYVIATVRVALGIVLISVASTSRTPKTLRVFGYIIMIAGITTALMGMVAIERADAIIEWWLQQGTILVRLSGVLIAALGGFLAYACFPKRRAP